MNEQLQQYLTQFVEQLKNAGEFTMEQLPLFIHEYLTYYTYYHGILSLLGLIGIIVLPIWYYKINKANNWNEGSILPTTTLGLVMYAPSIVAFFGNIFDFIQITIAPRLYLVENLLELVK